MATKVKNLWKSFPSKPLIGKHYYLAGMFLRKRFTEFLKIKMIRQKTWLLWETHFPFIIVYQETEFTKFLE